MAVPFGHESTLGRGRAPSIGFYRRDAPGAVLKSAEISVGTKVQSVPPQECRLQQTFETSRRTRCAALMECISRPRFLSELQNLDGWH